MQERKIAERVLRRAEDSVETSPFKALEHALLAAATFYSIHMDDQVKYASGVASRALEQLAYQDAGWLAAQGEKVDIGNAMYMIEKHCGNYRKIVGICEHKEQKMEPGVSFYKLASFELKKRILGFFGGFDERK